jgi:hypothetical protein
MKKQKHKALSVNKDSTVLLKKFLSQMDFLSMPTRKWEIFSYKNTVNV